MLGTDGAEKNISAKIYSSAFRGFCTRAAEVHQSDFQHPKDLGDCPLGIRRGPRPSGMPTISYHYRTLPETATIRNSV